MCNPDKADQAEIERPILVCIDDRHPRPVEELTDEELDQTKAWVEQSLREQETP